MYAFQLFILIERESQSRSWSVRIFKKKKMCYRVFDDETRLDVQTCHCV